MSSIELSFIAVVFQSSENWSHTIGRNHNRHRMVLFTIIATWLFLANCEDCRQCDHKVMVSRVRNEEMINGTRSSEQVMAGADLRVYWSVMDHG